MPDWSQVPIGTRVEYSREYFERSGFQTRQHLDRYGTLMGLHTNEVANTINWPQVLWDDESSKAARFGESSDLAWAIEHPDYLVVLGEGLTDAEKQTRRRKTDEDKLAVLKERRASIDREIAYLETKLRGRG